MFKKACEESEKMYERLLDKSISPTFNDLTAYVAECGALWLELDKHMRDVFSAKRQIRFPYGNKYGWSCKYSLKGKHICDVFAENGAFSLHFRIGSQQLEEIESELSEYAKNICNQQYPCAGGGWLTYRVLSQAHLSDAKKLLSAKLNLNRSGGV